LKVRKVKVPVVEQPHEAEVMRPFLERDMVFELWKIANDQRWIAEKLLGIEEHEKTPV